MTGVNAMLRVQGSSLIPTDEIAEETVRGLPDGRIVECQIIRRRSAKQLRGYWFVCGKVAQLLRACGHEAATKDYVDEVLRIGTGHCVLVPLSARLRAQTGQRYAVKATSIAMHAMDQTTFNGFMDRCLAFIATELLPHLPTRQLRQELQLAMELKKRTK